MTGKWSTEVISTMGDYSIVKGWTSAFGEGEFQYIELWKGKVVLAHDYYSKWLEHPNIEYWMEEYIALLYKQYNAKYEQVKELMDEGALIEEEILEISNTLDYYRGFGLTEERKQALDELAALSQDLGLMGDDGPTLGKKKEYTRKTRATNYEGILKLEGMSKGDKDE